MGKIYKDKGTESISRNLIFDNELSDRARFVYCFMMAKPDDWDFYVTPMAKELGYSADTLHKYINELIQRGWLTKVEQTRNEHNKFGAVDYVIHETRQEKKPDTEKSRDEETPTRKKAVTEKSRDGKFHPQKENIDNKENQEIKEIKREQKITSTIVDVPNADASAEKKYSITHRCRLIFEEEYLKKTGIEYYYSTKDAAAIKQLVGKIKKFMPDNEKNNEDMLEYNFTAFIRAILNSGKVEKWVLDNFSLPVINSKFNEIYSQLKNGTSRQYGTTKLTTADERRTIIRSTEKPGADF